MRQIPLQGGGRSNSADAGREHASEADGQIMADELWALLHGMAALYLDRVAPFDLERAKNAAMRLVSATRINPTESTAREREKN